MRLSVAAFPTQILLYHVLAQSVLLVGAQQLNCSLARASKERLTPADGEFENIQIFGLNKNGNIPGLTIEIIAIKQDEDPDARERTRLNIFRLFWQAIIFSFRILFLGLFGFPNEAAPADDENDQGEEGQGRLLSDAFFAGDIASVKRERFENGDGR